MINNPLIIEWAKISRENIINAENKLFSGDEKTARQARMIIVLNNYLRIYMAIEPSEHETKH